MNKEEYLKRKKQASEDFEKEPRRVVCKRCRRTMNSCLCSSIVSIPTKTKFVLLMHPMEAKKEKVGTGRLTHASLPNSEVIMGIDFTNDSRVNELIGDKTKSCYVMYPGKSAINISSEVFEFDYTKKELVVFVIDATWPCAKKMMKLSQNLLELPRLCFDPEVKSRFEIKQQPMEYCLSTIESVHYFLGALEDQGHEQLDGAQESLLGTLKALVDYQIACEEDPNRQTYRRNAFTPVEKRKKSVKWRSRSLFVD
ncbi:tRNA-uridine aminocarboxypropyltransferase [Halobacteriovorax sp. HLS]|uniref:tRNA-uridine aminocarboxypropyltransferase n=1 Tax=Halobacteriovorax sp. HLS TaxID=2234000 RepID=UPI000FDCAD6D|nr:tRNA-uridine aminocarboxypropyltransferase [Halobacteriovorax sp. HLS]